MKPASFGKGAGRSALRTARAKDSSVRSSIGSPTRQKVRNSAPVQVAPQRADAARALGALPCANARAQCAHRGVIQQLLETVAPDRARGTCNEEARTDTPGGADHG